MGGTGTTIYLDVDGVINAVSANNPSPRLTGWTDWERTTAGQWRILYAREVVEAINALATRDDVTIKWLTTWEDDAPADLCPALGINGQQWEVLHGDPECWRGDDWWKLRAIQSDVISTTPDRFIWIDDDIRTEKPAVDWVERRMNGLWIAPYCNWGLTRKHFDQIHAFIDAEIGAAA